MHTGAVPLRDQDQRWGWLKPPDAGAAQGNLLLQPREAHGRISDLLNHVANVGRGLRSDLQESRELDRRGMSA
jgi:hypothetical protein